MNRLRRSALSIASIAAAGISSQGFSQTLPDTVREFPGIFGDVGAVPSTSVEPGALSRRPVAPRAPTGPGGLQPGNGAGSQPVPFPMWIPINRPPAGPETLPGPATPAEPSDPVVPAEPSGPMTPGNTADPMVDNPSAETPENVQGNVSTAGVLCDFENVAYNSQPSLTYTSEATWRCTGTARSLVANGIPDHTVGQFPNANNPNVISEQRVSETFSLAPTESTAVMELGGPRGAVGYVLNGVKIDADTAGSCDDSGRSCSMIGDNGNWNIEALGQSHFDFGTDSNNAHVQPNGAYHYHGMPEGYLEKQGADGASMVLIGWAADGFPIYARYGYSNPLDADSGLKTITGSYTLVSSVPSNRPSVNSYALGTFKEDWVYVAGSGDLDECNGRFGVTPEFPEGIYHYYATDTYPSFQRCVRGAL